MPVLRDTYSGLAAQIDDIAPRDSGLNLRQPAINMPAIAFNAPQTAPMAKRQNVIYTQQGIIPTYYDLSGPEPGTVVGIVLGSVAGFLLICWLLQSLMNTNNRTGATTAMAERKRLWFGDGATRTAVGRHVVGRQKCARSAGVQGRPAAGRASSWRRRGGSQQEREASLSRSDIACRVTTWSRLSRNMTTTGKEEALGEAQAIGEQILTVCLVLRHTFEKPHQNIITSDDSHPPAHHIYPRIPHLPTPSSRFSNRLVYNFFAVLQYDISPIRGVQVAQ
ncbi:hypothetical protein P3342_000789 [Pyrenophora teres f. teres]|nr:hypothetical protein P3342_000789 [Pyrenophora teres f. teres]